MLKVDQYEYVRTARRVYGKSVSEIARETGHSRNTVKKVLRGEHRNYAAREGRPTRFWGRTWRSSTTGWRRTSW